MFDDEKTMPPTAAARDDLLDALDAYLRVHYGLPATAAYQLASELVAELAPCPGEDDGDDWNPAWDAEAAALENEQDDYEYFAAMEGAGEDDEQEGDAL